MSGFVKQLLALNGMEHGIYIEPYAGGAGVAWELLFSDCIDEVYLNDADRNIHAFWHAVINDTDALVAMIEGTAVTIGEWTRQSKILTSDNPKISLTERAFATFFLNRCNRSGILSAGPIGGKAQNGVWKLDVRFNIPALTARIRRIAAFKRQIHVSNMDALVFLDAIESIAQQPKTLLYLDPPYYRKGQTLYFNYYEPADHRALANYLKKQYASKKWMVSYDYCKPIAELYRGVRCSCQQLNYSVSSCHSKGTELVFFAPSLNIPPTVRLTEPFNAKKSKIHIHPGILGSEPHGA